MICIVWEQLPIYAARSIGAFVESCSEEVVVLRVPTSRFPIKGAVEMTKTKVIDVAFNDPRSLREILGTLPDVLVCGGWGEKSFQRWMREVRADGGRTIVCTDEPYRDRGWREFLRKWRYKLQLRRWIDFMFVSGGGGVRKFADYYGFPKDRVVTGLYAGDPKLFFNGKPLVERPKRFIYVGHYDANKNVIPMCQAFAQACHELGGQSTGWQLDVYGGGPLEEELRATAEKVNQELLQLSSSEAPHVAINGYVNADQLGPMYRDARCFVLGSHAEQWGVVVHEAAMSGCMLLLSSHVGSRFDFSCPENAVEFDPDSVTDFARGFKVMMQMTENGLRRGQDVSLSRGRQFSPQVFATNLKRMVDTLRGNK